MKKALSILLTIMLLFTLVPMGAFSISASADTAGYYTYTVDGDNATITDVDVSISGDVVIPSTLGDCLVTSIGSYAFRECSNITSVTIPNTIESVGAYAFGNCTSLKSAVLPDSITVISHGMFAYCSSLEEVNIHGCIEEIGDVAFYECSALESVAIPDSVTLIGSYAFKFCTSLKEVVVPDSVVEMDLGIFEGCTSLEKLTLPFFGYSITEPGLPFAFIFGTTEFIESNNYVPASLKTVEITNATSIPSNAFVNCKNIENIVIPDSVTTIGDLAFGGCINLTNVYIGEGVTKITKDQFAGCKSLTSITVSEGNTNYSDIDGVLFSKNKKSLMLCPKGKSGAYIIPDGVTSIYSYAFENCINLTSITIPEGVTSVSIYAFSGCSGINSITIPYSVKTIVSNAFEGCVNLVSVVIENGVKRIGSYAFSGCTNLNSISIPNSVTGIDAYAFSGCTNLNGISIPNSVTDIGSYAFSGCSKLDSITIPDSVTSIEQHVFSGCTSLTSIKVSENNENYSAVDGVLFNKDKKMLVLCPEGKSGGYAIPNSTIRIGAYAFNNCSGITSITLTNSVRIIAEYVFNGCDSLDDVYYIGSETDKDAIIIDYFNDSLMQATWHYNACVGSVTHMYDNACDTDCNVCGAIRKTVHEFKWVLIDNATKAANGIFEQVCSMCQTKGNTEEFEYVTIIQNLIKSDADVKRLEVSINADYITKYLSLAVKFTQNENETVVSEYEKEDNKLVFSYITEKNDDVEIEINAITNNGNTVAFAVQKCDLGRFGSKNGKQYLQYTELDQGDANGDGVTDVKDLVRTKKILAELTDKTDNADISGDGNMTTGDLVLLAKYIVSGKKGMIAHTVTFADSDGSTLLTMLVPDGFSAKPDIVPQKDGYTFSGWDKEYYNVTSDIVVTATYSQNTDDI